MNKRRDLSWIIAIIAIAAGFLIGLWAGSQWLPRLSGAQVSELSAEQQDEYVTLVALGYAQTGDLAQVRSQLEALDAPNLSQLAAGVIERKAAAGAPSQVMAALAQMASALGVSNTMIAAYLPTATPPPTPTPIPPTPTPLPPTATPTPDIPSPTPTVTPEPVTATPTVPAKPVAIASGEVNVRSGPGLTYAVIADMTLGEVALLIGRNDSGDWWQVQRDDGSTGWVLGQLVTTEGDLTGIPVAAAPPPPTATKVAVVATPTPPRPTPPPPTAKPSVDFIVKGVRLWGVQENGGSFDGPSLHCGEKRQLRGLVTDAAGQPINGVTLLGIYSNSEQVTGSKGPGLAEWILGDGDGLRVIRDADGRAVVSETAEGLVTDPARIPDPYLIAAGYCTDAASCNSLRSTNACHGHYSWDVTFQRTY